MKCSRCQQDAPSDAEFCPECGTKLAAVCAQCGTANASGHKFCKKCGQPLTSAAEAKPEGGRFGSPESRRSRSPRRIAPQIQLLTVAPEPGPVVLSNGLTVLAQYGVGDCPPADALIITGGPGWPAQTANTVTLDFIRARAKDSVVMSVCTGGMILAATGLLDGCHATTKREVVSPEEQPLALMHIRYPKVRAVEAQLVDEGRLITAGGVSLCIDATLHLLERMLGAEVASETARILEYTTARSANQRAWAFASRAAAET